MSLLSSLHLHPSKRSLSKLKNHSQLNSKQSNKSINMSILMTKSQLSKNSKSRSPSSNLKIKTIWCSALKDAGENSIEKHFKSMPRPAKLFSCPKGNSSTPKPRE
jgi:hypothetical protein